jgi:hypothetical protein
MDDEGTNILQSVIATFTLAGQPTSKRHGGVPFQRMNPGIW